MFDAMLLGRRLLIGGKGSKSGNQTNLTGQIRHI
jgi:hypothetical protein